MVTYPLSHRHWMLSINRPIMQLSNFRTRNTTFKAQAIEDTVLPEKDAQLLTAKRLKNTLNYGPERVWPVGYMKMSRRYLGIAFDVESLVENFLSKLTRNQDI